MKIVSLKENIYFKRAYYKGKSVVKKRIVVYYRKNNLEYSRLGITVSTKVGKAVLRNRIRRLIRENYRLLPNVKSGYDIVIVARKSAAFTDFYGIKSDIEGAFFESGLSKRNELD